MVEEVSSPFFVHNYQSIRVLQKLQNWGVLKSLSYALSPLIQKEVNQNETKMNPATSDIYY